MGKSEESKIPKHNWTCVHASMYMLMVVAVCIDMLVVVVWSMYT